MQLIPLKLDGTGFSEDELRLEENSGTFVLDPLPYEYDALEPYIDRQTMEIHHGKHHQGYVNNLNRLVGENKIEASLESLLKNVSSYPTGIRNNGGGHWNHTFFWKMMSGKVESQPGGMIAEAIDSSFGSMDKFKNAFNDAASKRFGSGWAWLIRTAEGKLEITSTPNQDNPLMDVAETKGVPILGVDVWEHAYYLKYQNRRGDYLQAWWNVVNWNQVAANLMAAENMK
ncbi:MAG: superoxide dismutase [Bacteroidetes bacterium]|nr:MAG: superoxide dismutase [Bacteroidota bacterium]REK05837.1 MAG: superoxide dismutase [Bacteroidota bacterium]REK32026.1 MAG: superoxide dismutase [Bacteroidota bacterium]REK50090.1 MAG: superoxide dismutase [Bacteroidota bacterium]